MILPLHCTSARRSIVPRYRSSASLAAPAIPWRKPSDLYVALMRAGKELCHDPALALHFGEAFDCAEISIVGLIGGACDTLAEAFAQINRYARLAVEVDLGAADRFQLQRHGQEFWMVDTRKNPNEFPELTESTYARMVCTSQIGRAA